MKYLFLFVLLLPFSLLAQNPIRHMNFPSRDKAGYTLGEINLSPNGTMIMATFIGTDDATAYDLVNVADGRLLSSGKLPSRPYTIIWNEDESLVALKYKSGNPECFDVRNGFKKIFTCSADGEIAFTKNRSLLKKDPVLLYVFGDDAVRIYTSTGQLKDSVQLDDYDSYAYAWYDAINDHFNLVKSTEDEISIFSKKAEAVKTNTITAATLVDGREVNKDGNKYLYYTNDALWDYDAATGKQALNYKGNDISAAAFTPDSKNVIIKNPAGFTMIDQQGKQNGFAAQGNFYFKLGYAAFGTELVAITTNGADIYACKNYLPVAQEKSEAKPAEKKAPVVPTPPVANKPAEKQIAPAAKWSLPYTITDFITPLQSDSFYLYSPDRKIRYRIVYQKMESSVLWANPYSYTQHFGIASEPKYLSASVYILSMVDGNARFASYYQSSLLKENQQMIGGQIFMAKIPPVAGQTISWPVKMYDEEYTLSARVIDNTYKGKKAKCLVISRKDNAGEGAVDETDYYQQGVGLIKIESAGKVAAER